MDSKSIIFAGFSIISIFITNILLNKSIIEKIIENTNALSKMQESHDFLSISNQSFPNTEENSRKQLKFCLFKTDNNTKRFESIRHVIEKLGYQEVPLHPHAPHYDWDFIWSYHGISPLNLNFSNWKDHQRHNHIPGMPFLTLKSNLATYTDSKYVPKGFEDKLSIQRYAKDHPDVRFVRKNKANRGVSIVTVEEMNFTRSNNIREEFFAQVFVEDPYLINGHKFDLNMYAGISSIDPLRVYYYDKTYNLRFCEKPYNPNNFDDPDTYVITDNYIPGLRFPFIKKITDHGYLEKEPIQLHFMKQGINPKIIDDQIEDAISTIVLQKAPKMLKKVEELNAANGKYHFFELVRFDFMLDAKLKLHLMEVNMSPNLEAYPKRRGQKIIYENVVYNFLNLVGMGTTISDKSVGQFTEDESRFVLNDHSISVTPDICLNRPCNETCDSTQCDLCLNCMSDSFKYDLKLAFWEHMNMGEFRRVVPPPNINLLETNSIYWKNLSPTNTLYAKWLIEMCKKNSRFC
ncbi:CLUMA_CG005397, isoform A [Clunio marinus]|uniref:CLUMA_CG005397, isoform A n=1 Tax=Clunio marinus TaxID=568069 RepID=A0A1J1HUT5_9DIPT|nr:CLUMA_CG005397, isoform A [Clunio marinus]